MFLIGKPALQHKFPSLLDVVNALQHKFPALVTVVNNLPNISQLYWLINPHFFEK